MGSHHLAIQAPGTMVWQCQPQAITIIKSVFVQHHTSSLAFRTAVEPLT